MSQTMTISEPTHALGEAEFMQQFDAPTPPRELDRDAPPTWRLPRLAPEHKGWHPSIVKSNVAPREGFLTLELKAETAASARHLLDAENRAVELDAHTEAHGQVMGCPEYASAAGILPLLAGAERKLKAANDRLAALNAKKAKSVAKPTPTLGKALVEIEAERESLTREIAEHRAEVDALSPAARSARAALVEVAKGLCRTAQHAQHDSRVRLLRDKIAAFVAANSEALTEIAMLNGVRLPVRPPDAEAMVKMFERDWLAPTDGE